MEKILLKLLDFLENSDELLVNNEIVNESQESKENVLRFLNADSLTDIKKNTNS